MRVLIVSNSRTPNNDALFREVSAQPGVDLLAAYCCEREHFRQWQLGPVQDYPSVTMPGWSIGLSGHINPAVVAVIRRFDPDVAILSGTYTMPTFLMAAAALRLRGTPWAYWGEPLMMDSVSFTRRATRTIVRQPIRIASAVLAIGRRGVDSYTRIGVPREQIANFHYHADVESFQLAPSRRDAVRQRVRSQLDLPRDATVFLFCGQLIPRKGVETLLDAAALVRERHAEFGIVLAGDGPSRAGLEERAHRKGIVELVRFAGFTQPDVLPPYFAAADALVLPSRQEGWGMVVPEALAAGLPVLASEAVNAGVELVEHGDSGYLFPVDDARALADGMSRMIESPMLRERMSERARAIGAAESPRLAAKRLVRLLEAVRDGRQMEGL